MNKYTGPWSNIKTIDPKLTYSVKGTRAEVHAKLNEGSNLVELEDVYGRAISLNPQHALSVEEQSPSDVGFTPFGT